jgi:toxin ParE1/3/4
MGGNPLPQGARSPSGIRRGKPAFIRGLPASFAAGRLPNLYRRKSARLRATDRWGLEQAETYIRQLWKDIQTVADNPSLGQECAEVRPGYRKHPSGSRVLFHRLTDDGIDVVRILHERMDCERHIP